MSGPADFVGKGFAFPMRVDASGGIALSGAEGDVGAAMRMILSTAPGERVFRPDFGCRIWDLLFHPINASTIGLMAEAVRAAVGQWEPRVDLEDVTIEPDPYGQGLVHIDLTYRIRATNDRRNLVYPFYVIPKEEGQ
jgi:uncharacterized protein